VVLIIIVIMPEWLRRQGGADDWQSCY